MEIALSQSSVESKANTPEDHKIFDKLEFS